MKEYEIRPKKVFDDYLKISEKDIKKYFSNTKKFVDVPCVGCKSSNTDFAFEKHGFTYKQCKECFTLFASPRPTEDMIDTFYRESESSKFWAKRFFPETAEARRMKIFRPRAQLVGEIIGRYDLKKPLILADAGAGFGIFLEEVKNDGMFDKVIGIEPSTDLAQTCVTKGFTVIKKPAEKIDDNELQASVICSFEVLEHLFDPDRFIAGLARITQPGGLLLITTLTISGIDLQVLWNDSKSISPPHHLNFPSVEGLKAIIERCGLEEIEICTPGKLDVDIIKNTMRDNPGLQVPRFIEYLINNRDQETLAQMQQFLQANNLSSHARIVARKRSS
ncbi:methyltransferase domain-containing protein [Fibrobacterota bacterium]